MGGDVGHRAKSSGPRNASGGQFVGGGGEVVLLTTVLITTMSRAFTRNGNLTNVGRTADVIASCFSPNAGLVCTVNTIMNLVKNVGICNGFSSNSPSADGATTD